MSRRASTQATQRQSNKRNDNQKHAEGADDRRARRQVPVERQKQTGDAADERDDPADEQPVANAPREIDSTNCRHNQVTEDQQHTGDPDKTCHDQTEDGVKQKVPPTHAQAFLVGPVSIERYEEKVFAQDKMKNSDGNEKSEAFPNFQGRHE